MISVSTLTRLCLFSLAIAIGIHSSFSQTIRLEAEDGVTTGVSIESSHTGYSGTGYVTGWDNGDGNASSVTVTANISVQANYQVRIGYSTPYGYKENNVKIGSGAPQVVAFDDISNDWGFVTVATVNLSVGAHTFQVTENWGWFELDYIELTTVVGNEPEAHAETAYKLILDINQDGFEEVDFLGSQSIDSDGTIESYYWTNIDGDTIASTADFSMEFEAGIHTVNLLITDNDGNEVSDELTFLVTGDNLNNNGHNRIPIRDGEGAYFMSGINIAWSKPSNFAQDMTNFIEDDWEEIFNAIEQAGGNACRWWLHTNGTSSPQWDGSGNVTGLSSQEIPNMKKALDMAAARGIMISMCLWSFDMLHENAEVSNQTRNKALLEDPVKTQTYIDNALIPILQAIGDHPAVMCWEIFNEPEGMTAEFGWSLLVENRTNMQSIQQFVNLCAGAIHRTVPTALVSNGSWSARASSDVFVGLNDFDYYSDEALIAAGNDEDGTLDFVQFHYYDHFTIEESPFYHPASYWGIDKPIVIGEFPAYGFGDSDAEEAYRMLYDLGYAGAMSWSWSDLGFGGFASAKSGMEYMHTNHSADIVIPIPDQFITSLSDDLRDGVKMFPNPTEGLVYIHLERSDITVVAVYDMTGKQIQYHQPQEGQEVIIDVKNASSGLYYVHLRGEHLFLSRRFVKH